jgi:hypothetical protein
MEFKEIIKSMTLVNLFVFFFVFVIGVINGFDLKKDLLGYMAYGDF